MLVIINNNNYVNCFQIFRENKMSIGKISSRPMSISADKIILERFENPEKLPVGPITESPGPMFPMVAATAVKFVVKSKPLRLIRSRAVAKINIKAIKKTFIDRRVSCSTILPLSLTFATPLG